MHWLDSPSAVTRVLLLTATERRRTVTVICFVTNLATAAVMLETFAYVSFKIINLF